nr:Chain A, Capsid protein [Penaeus vannamei nodavirus]5YKZ_B Chain B, Capsid protein [Penaeus vannamei nodavirus]5YL0_A Chain A, Capsid protein [Penaeus vannamei nodavirus]5YL0_B Chain B, Capsid protein [Penaeus vannamei nodavirus]5YL0_C Chain C, Capsid protein [Penaeus vannamei nodavirus]5YL0_D Chain D, Capsid protein [Penaeus vannamei nodavirus]
NPTSLTDVRVDKAVNFIKPEVSGVAEIQTVTGLSPSTSYLLTPAFLEQNFQSEAGIYILSATPVEGEGTISINMDPTVTTVSGFIKVKTDTFGTFDLSVVLTTASKKQTTGFNIIAATS